MPRDSFAGAGPRLRPRVWLALALVLLLTGVGLAAWTERAGGVAISDVRFRGPDGVVFSALLYHPAAATPKAPAPGILAVHGYLNTRETQSPFAIEFARRGYVVLALDQRGHGYSGGAATTKGFGGPEGLAYLRSLPFVDRNQIGLEGHSMGGWTVLAAAAAMPDAYRSLVLEGSSVGAPFAKEGTPTWPRNLAVVYSRFDEFAPLMWGIRRADDIGSAPKLMATFDTTTRVATDRIYGNVAAGSGRRLSQPLATHPGDHLSREAVADATSWFATTLKGGRPRPRLDQIWWWKEAGTGLGLIGLAALTFGLFDWLLGQPLFAPLRGAPMTMRRVHSLRWWLLLGLTIVVPALSYYCLPLGSALIKPSALFPQGVTNTLMVWAVLNVILGLAYGRILSGPRTFGSAPWLLSGLLAVIVVSALYAVVALAAFLDVDFRFWVVALKPMSGRQTAAALSYLLPFTLFVVVAFRGLAALAVNGTRSQYAVALVALAGGFFFATGTQYAWLFATGALPWPFEALNAIVAIQFVPLLGALAILAVYTWRRTGGYAPGALIGGLFVTWYMVAGTAIHAA